MGVIDPNIERNWREMLAKADMEAEAAIAARNRQRRLERQLEYQKDQEEKRRRRQEQIEEQFRRDSLSTTERIIEDVCDFVLKTMERLDTWLAR